MPSSVIAQYIYHPDKELLDLVFISGKRYQYEAVPAAVYEAFRKATSKGYYFNKYIREHFKFRKIS